MARPGGHTNWWSLECEVPGSDEQGARPGACPGVGSSCARTPPGGLRTHPTRLQPLVAAASLGCSGKKGQPSWGLSPRTQRTGTVTTVRALETRTPGLQPRARCPATAPPQPLPQGWAKVPWQVLVSDTHPPTGSHVTAELHLQGDPDRAGGLKGLFWWQGPRTTLPRLTVPAESPGPGAAAESAPAPPPPSPEPVRLPGSTAGSRRGHVPLQDRPPHPRAPTLASLFLLQGPRAWSDPPLGISSGCLRDSSAVTPVGRRVVGTLRLISSTRKRALHAETRAPCPGTHTQCVHSPSRVGLRRPRGPGTTVCRSESDATFSGLHHERGNRPRRLQELLSQGRRAVE